jgi:hypothetical protein
MKTGSKDSDRRVFTRPIFVDESMARHLQVDLTQLTQVKSQEYTDLCIQFDYNTYSKLILEEKKQFFMIAISIARGIISQIIEKYGSEYNFFIDILNFRLYKFIIDYGEGVISLGLATQHAVRFVNEINGILNAAQDSDAQQKQQRTGFFVSF